MKAHTTTTNTNRRSRDASRRVLALVLAIFSLAMPATAGAIPFYSSPNGHTGGSEQPSTPVNGSNDSSVNSTTGGSRESSSIGKPGGVSGTPSNHGFDWLSAAVGAGAAMALVALGGAALLTYGRRTAPSASTS